MTADDEVTRLIERVFDDDLSSAGRAAQAARLQTDSTLREAVDEASALALLVRAATAEDQGRCADLLMASLSGSRRMALNRRITRALTPVWPWRHLLSGALAAGIAFVIGFWWFLGEMSGCCRSNERTTKA